jgi:hemerythrin-like metal-binding protein
MIEERFVHYRTGYKAIDDEHFALLLSVDKIIRLCREKFIPEQTITDLMQELDSQLKAHFLHEEELMRESSFKFYDGHKKVHGELHARFTRLLYPPKFDHTHARYLITELENIFVHHIDDYDMQIKLSTPPACPTPI